MPSSHTSPERFFSCDWGTTRLRLRLVDRSDGTILAEYCSGEGVARLAGSAPGERPQAFRQALAAAVAQVAAEVGPDPGGADVRALPILISGMASSSIGWHELPYARLPFALDGSDLVFRSLRRLNPQLDGEIALISGLASEQDVMRGEETEVLGAVQLMCAGPLRAWGQNIREKGTAPFFSQGTEKSGQSPTFCPPALSSEGILILPGTHSKHVHMREGHIVGFRTFMTGELFDVLSSHSVLRHSVSAPTEPGAGESITAFKEGVQLGAALPLAAALFQVRTRALLAGGSPADCRELLSGIFIAAELVALRQPPADTLPIVLAAPPALASSYQRASVLLGLADRLTTLSAVDVERLAAVGQSLVLPRILAAAAVSQ